MKQKALSTRVAVLLGAMVLVALHGLGAFELQRVRALGVCHSAVY